MLNCVRNASAYFPIKGKAKKEMLTSLGNDGAGNNNDDGPVEFGLEVRDNLLVHFAESVDRSVGDAHEQGLAGGAVCLGVFNQLSAVDEDL